MEANFIEYPFLNFDLHKNHLRIFLKCKFD